VCQEERGVNGGEKKDNWGETLRSPQHKMYSRGEDSATHRMRGGSRPTPLTDRIKGRKLPIGLYLV